ncbi:MAG: LapA family protein [Synergistaceae bacterium]|nr:LapA family protein [Synergistaceae bacterium]
MKVYILAIAVSILLTAIYSVQNSDEITVRFFSAWTFRQGVWEAVLFSGGAVIMWLFSVFGSWEMYLKNKKIIKEKDKRISELEEEKKSLFSAIRVASGEMDASYAELQQIEEQSGSLLEESEKETERD